MDFDDLDDLDPVEVADPSTEKREYDIIIYGASGYTGRLMAQHLDALLSKDGAEQLKWAIAGRSKVKLRNVARLCKQTPEMLEVNEPSEISSMLTDCRVVINAAGPYQVSGEEIVRECVNRVTHYIDISGDFPWIRSMIDKYHAKAKEKGVMIVNFAGATATPDEICCYSLVKKLGPLKQYREYFCQYGAISGGTYNSSKVNFETMTPEKLAMMNDPFVIGGTRASGVRDVDLDQTEAEEDGLYPELWTAPAYNSSGGTRCVRRTCALFEEISSDGVKYGADFSVVIRQPYARKNQAQTQMANMTPVKDMEVAAFLAKQHHDSVQAGQAPSPGQGPPAATRKLYTTELYAVAEGENGEWAHAHYSQGEAYELSAMAAVTGALVLCTELDAVKPKERGGILTPAFALHGSTWIDRLTADTFCADLTGKKVVLEIKDGKPDPDDVKKAAVEVNKMLLAGQSKLMKGELKTWT